MHSAPENLRRCKNTTCCAKDKTFSLFSHFPSLREEARKHPRAALRQHPHYTPEQENHIPAAITSICPSPLWARSGFLPNFAATRTMTPSMPHKGKDATPAHREKYEESSPFRRHLSGLFFVRLQFFYFFAKIIASRTIQPKNNTVTQQNPWLQLSFQSSSSAICA